MRNAMLVLPATLVAPLHVGDHCSSSPRCWTMSLAVGKGSRSLVVGKHGADDVPWAWKNGCRGSAVGLGWDPLRAPNRCLPRANPSLALPFLLLQRMMMRRFTSLLVCAWLVGVPAVPVALVPVQELAVSNVSSEAMKVHKVCCSRVHPGQQTNKKLGFNVPIRSYHGAVQKTPDICEEVCAQRSRNAQTARHPVVQSFVNWIGSRHRQWVLRVTMGRSYTAPATPSSAGVARMGRL